MPPAYRRMPELPQKRTPRRGTGHAALPLLYQPLRRYKTASPAASSRLKGKAVTAELLRRR